MPVSAAQNAAFSASTGGTTMSAYGILIVSMVGTLIFLWAAWAISSSGKAWVAEKADLYDVLWTTARVAILVTMVGYWIRP